MKSNVKKLAVILMFTLIFTLSMMGLKEVFADNLPTITNVKITEDGILTWDPVEGADLYWLGVGSRLYTLHEWKFNSITCWN